MRLLYDDAPENFQRQVLGLVIWAGEKWFTISELAEHVGDLMDALDAMRALSDAGLIHRQGEYVFPTRAAVHVHHLFEMMW